MSASPRTIAVIGGAGGIGAAVVAALAGRGDRAWAMGRSLADDPLRRHARTDATDEAAVLRALALVAEHDGALDALVVAHGGGHFGALVDLAPRDFADDLAAHASGTLVALRAAARVMTGGGGDVVVIGSIAAQEILPGSAGYGAAKAAQRHLALAAAEELRPLGIRVTLVHPGAVDTPIWDRRAERFDRTRMMRPEDVARAVLHALDTPAGAHLAELTLKPRGGVLSPEE